MAKNTYKLYYYDWTGLGEISRLLFALSDTPFEDVRIPLDSKNFPLLSTEWKEKTPWGQVPMLEVNGKKFAQASALNRFLARRFGLAGANEFENTKCDEFVDAIKDWTTEWQKLFVERDPAKQEDIKKHLFTVANPKYFNKFNKAIADNGGRGLVGSGTTWADVYLCHLGTYFEEFCDCKYIEDYPAIDAMVQKFYSKPEVKNWMAKRPKPANDFSFAIFDNIMKNLMKK